MGKDAYRESRAGGVQTGILELEAQITGANRAAT